MRCGNRAPSRCKAALNSSISAGGCSAGRGANQLSPEHEPASRSRPSRVPNRESCGGGTRDTGRKNWRFSPRAENGAARAAAARDSAANLQTRLAPTIAGSKSMIRQARFSARVKAAGRPVRQRLLNNAGDKFLRKRESDIRADAVRFGQAKREPASHPDALHDDSLRREISARGGPNIAASPAQRNSSRLLVWRWRPRFGEQNHITSHERKFATSSISCSLMIPRPL